MQVSYEFLYAKTYRLQERVMLSVSGNVLYLVVDPRFVLRVLVQSGGGGLTAALKFLPPFLVINKSLFQ